MTEFVIDGIRFNSYDLVDSTNKIALEADTAPHLLTVTAERQNGGRGRMGRKYFSYSGGLYMSVVLDVKQLNIPIHLCTPAAAVAVRGALADGGVTDVYIKWVNDLYKNGRKICGILTECRSYDGSIQKIVVGIGINLTEPEGGFPEDIKDKAGCAYYGLDKKGLALKIVKELDRLIHLSSADVIGLYCENMANIGERAVVTDYSDGNKKLEGRIIGVNEDCFLRLLLDDGTERLLSSGEII